MMNQGESMKEIDLGAQQALQSLLSHIPNLQIKSIRSESADQSYQIDFVVHFSYGGTDRTLLCEVKPSGQPRYVRAALHQLRNYLAHARQPAIPVLIAPYLSPQARALCVEDGAGYLDLQGNARIAFDSVFIERIISDAPPAERRELKSLFKPKSAQVLRVMLRDPHRSWRVADLAEAARVSIGHVSNVRKALHAREWLEVSEEGMFLRDPNALLDAWRKEYELPSGKRLGFYTALHGASVQDAVRHVLGTERDTGKAILSSFSAAQWIAPYGRSGSQHFYADTKGVENLTRALNLSPASKGENVVIVVPKDEGLFIDSDEPSPGIVSTSPVQTYLDLSAMGERGAEAADHLRREKLAW
jgi:hypothetical protein